MAWDCRGSDLFEGPVQDLIDELGKLPGIGPKSAQRIAFHLLSVEPPDIDRLTAVLEQAARPEVRAALAQRCAEIAFTNGAADAAAWIAGKVVAS